MIGQAMIIGQIGAGDKLHATGLGLHDYTAVLWLVIICSVGRRCGSSSKQNAGEYKGLHHVFSF